MEAGQTTLHTDIRAINTEFKDYAYSVSHDLGAPVRAMVEFSKLLTKEHTESLNNDGKEYLSIIVQNGHKLQEMMDGLLVYSRLNTQAAPFSEVDCNNIVSNCKIIMQDKILERNILMEVHSLPTIKADVNQIFQLFTALIDNAIKFQPEANKPHIIISAERKGDSWQFAVEDNGIGIAPNFKEKIFKLFQKLHTDEKYPGVGFGLTMAKRIVHRHGGKIWFDSTYGRGTTFYFTVSA